jgi:hypothetical protein
MKPVLTLTDVKVGLALGILSHGDQNLGSDLPVVEQPLDGHMRVGKHDVVVEGNDDIVLLQHLLGEDDLGPMRGAVLVLGDAEKLVRVAMDRCVEIVAEKAGRVTGQMIPRRDILGKDAALIVEVTVVDIENQDPRSHGFPLDELLGRRELPHLATGSGELRSGDGEDQGSPKRADDGGDILQGWQGACAAMAAVGTGELRRFVEDDLGLIEAATSRSRSASWHRVQERQRGLLV